jgi:hypothetical protein
MCCLLSLLLKFYSKQPDFLKVTVYDLNIKRNLSLFCTKLIFPLSNDFYSSFSFPFESWAMKKVKVLSELYGSSEAQWDCWADSMEFWKRRWPSVFTVTPITLATCLPITGVKPRNIQSFTQKLLRTFHTVLWHQKRRCNSIMLD